MKRKKRDELKGDKLRELILLVYLNNKYGKDKNKISWLKEKLGYSTGGLYHALNESGYFERKGDEIWLTEKGFEYLNKHLLPQYTVLHPIGNFFIILGFVFLLQWYLWTHLHTPLIFPWHSAVVAIVLGVILRFFILRIIYWIIANRKRKQTELKTTEIREKC